MDWPRLLAYITGSVDQELLLRNEYLAAENRILKAQIKGRLQLSDAERRTLAEIAHRLGRQSFEEVAVSAKPATIQRSIRLSKSFRAIDTVRQDETAKRTHIVKFVLIEEVTQHDS